MQQTIKCLEKMDDTSNIHVKKRVITRSAEVSSIQRKKFFQNTTLKGDKSFDRKVRKEVFPERGNRGVEKHRAKLDK